MHAQARRRVDLDDPAALLFQRLVHGLADDIDAADIQPDHLRRFHRPRRHLRMDVVGHIGRRAAGAQIGVVAQDDALAHGGDRVHAVILYGETGQRDVVEPYPRQRGGMPLAAARVAVHLGDEFAHRVDAIADHVRRFAAGRGDQPVADHEQAVIMARDEALHQHFLADRRRGRRTPP